MLWKECQRIYNMPLNIEELKKRHGQNASQFTKKYPESTEPFFEDKSETKTKKKAKKNEDEDEPINESKERLQKKRELITKLFDENQDLPMEEMLTYYFTEGEGKKMGKTVSPLKGIREGLEDMLNIQQLQDLIKGFRDRKKQSNTQQDEIDEDMGDDNSLITMLPFLQKMQNGGMDVGKIDPLMLMLSMGMGGQKKSNNNLGQLFLMMSMANMFAQQPQQTQIGNNGNPNQQPTPAINAEMIKSLYTELQKVMESQSKPQFDPMTLLMIDAIKKSNANNGAASNQNIEILLDKFNQMMQNNQTQTMAMLMERSNEKFEKGMEMIASALHREKPEEKMMNYFGLFRELAGDRREKTKDEMEYDLKRKEMELQEFARRDMLDREEREKEREEMKSQRMMDTAGVVLDKVIGNGIGHLVKDVMSVRGKGDKQKNTGFSQEEIDPSLLDDL